MKIERAFYSHRERYHYDFEKCKRSDGWIQFDTKEDAHYFGIWVNPEKMQVLTWAEGDEILETAESETEFHEHLKSMAECYGEPPPAFITIDKNGQVMHYFDERPK
jgi:hypothetical protein